MDRATFSTLLHATGEWDREYSAVIDSVMPFGSLVAHLATAEIGARSRGVGLATAKTYFPSATAASSDSADWHIERLRWNAWYLDYGGEAKLELFMRPIGDRLVVLAFMHASWPEVAGCDRDVILTSFRHR